MKPFDSLVPLPPLTVLLKGASITITYLLIRLNKLSGVAVGSSIGHAIGGFFGGSSSAPVEQPAQTAQTSTYEAPKVCQNEVFSFRKCMDDNQGDLNVCGWYLDQLKACQASASHY